MASEDADERQIDSPPRQPLKRLQKRHTHGEQRAEAVHASEGDVLADSLARLSVQPLQAAAALVKITERRPAADWSDESDDGADDDYVTVASHASHTSQHSTDESATRADGSTVSDEEDKEEGAGCSDGSVDASDGAALVLNDFKLPGCVAKVLYAHQVEGVRWLWGLHKMQRGGILGDDMGLGKTLQCSAFLAGMFASKLISRAMIVAPKTLLAHWEKELKVCGMERMVFEYYGSSQNDREAALSQVFNRKGILLTTYGMVLHNASSLSKAPRQQLEDEEKSLWDFMILDEGHKIKNAKTQLAQKLREIQVAVSVIISGTPIQNNLMEMHALFDFVCPGLLGDAKFFKLEYERPITHGNDKHATERARAVAAGKGKALREHIAPYLLRREKKEVLPDNSTITAGSEVSASEDNSVPKPQSMGRKNDLVVWLRLQPQQQRIYEAFLNSQAVKAALNKTGSALAAITVLKKICDHPALLGERAVSLVAKGGIKLSKGTKVVTKDDFIVDDDEVEYETSENSSSGEEDSLPAKGEAELLEEDWLGWAEGSNVEEKLRHELHSRGASASCKTLFISSLITELVAKGHRTLVFSQSRVMLDILGDDLSQHSVTYLRIDGSSSAAERQALVHKFQTRDNIPIFLLTSQVGGLGLTLTAADRVIIVDPAWNPSTDNQSVDRAYRIGQSKDVVVYRLITCGTVEEKIYRKQVFKGGLARSGTEEGVQFRYFSQQDLSDLFRVEPEELIKSTTQAQLHNLHSNERAASTLLAEHLAYLEEVPCYTGVSDHDLLFSKKAADTEESDSAGAAFPPMGTGRRASSTAQVTAPSNRRPKQASSFQGWQGASNIADMLAHNLKLDPVADGARPPGADWADPRIRLAPNFEDLQSLRAQLERMQRLQSSGTQALLPDGGTQLRAKIAHLQGRIASASGGAQERAQGAAFKGSAQSSQAEQDLLTNRGGGSAGPSLGSGLTNGESTSKPVHSNTTNPPGTSQQRSSGAHRPPKVTLAAQVEPETIDISSPEETAQLRPRTSPGRLKENLQDHAGALGAGKRPAERIAGVATLKGLPKGLAAALRTPFPEHAQADREMNCDETVIGSIPAVLPTSQAEPIQSHPQQAGGADQLAAVQATSQGAAAAKLPPAAGGAASQQRKGPESTTTGDPVAQIHRRPSGKACSSVSGMSSSLLSSGGLSQASGPSAGPDSRVRAKHSLEASEVSKGVSSKQGAGEAANAKLARPDQLATLVKESHQLKGQLRDLLAILGDKAQQKSLPDQGRELKVKVKKLNAKREAIKQRIAQLQQES